ncbi:MAG TPA: hypothetical protein VIL05_05700 [Thermoclostridium sp.]
MKQLGLYDVDIREMKTGKEYKVYMDNIGNLMKENLQKLLDVSDSCM